MMKYQGKCHMEFIKDYVVVDIETTGLVATQDEIIEIGALRVRDHEIVDRFNVLLKPSMPISSFISKLTGITNEMVFEKGQEPAYALSEFLSFLGEDLILGHNVYFDIGFLFHHLYQQLGIVLENDCIDTMRLARKHLKGMVPNNKLGTLTNYFGFDYHGAHRALADCVFTHQVYGAIHEVSLGFR